MAPDAEVVAEAVVDAVVEAVVDPAVAEAEAAAAAAKKEEEMKQEERLGDGVRRLALLRGARMTQTGTYRGRQSVLTRRLGVMPQANASGLHRSSPVPSRHS